MEGISTLKICASSAIDHSCIHQDQEPAKRQDDECWEPRQCFNGASTSPCGRNACRLVFFGTALAHICDCRRITWSNVLGAQILILKNLQHLVGAL